MVFVVGHPDIHGVGLAEDIAGGHHWLEFQAAEPAQPDIDLLPAGVLQFGEVQ